MKKIAKLMTLGAASAMAVTAPTPAVAGDTPWIGEMVVVPYTFCPRGWVEASGQLLAISSHSALFSLLGTNFGGDGRSTFGVPDLKGRSVVGLGTGAGLDTVTIGEKGGREYITLTTANLPSHNHTGQVRSENTANADTGNAAGNALGRTTLQIYSDTAAPTAAGALHSGTLSINNTGGSQSFNSRNPFLGMRNCMSTIGTYPSRN